jgi:hypothetical protein
MRNRLIHLYPFTALLLGMILTQMLASVHVYLSNRDLYDSMMAIKDAGYLPIPNPHVMGQLHKTGPAFFGGLFFTFSIGLISYGMDLDPRFLPEAITSLPFSAALGGMPDSFEFSWI